MGFTTGFLGGVTLTYSVLYLGLHIHRANRSVQKTLLAQQSSLLNSVVEPLDPIPDPPAYEVRRAGLAEEIKDRWNREVEKLVRNVQGTDWMRVREDAERRVSDVWRQARASETAQEVESKSREAVEQVRSGVQDSIADGREKLRDTIDTSREKVKEAVDLAGGKVVEAVGAATEKIEELGNMGQKKLEELNSASKEAREKVEEKTMARPKRLLEIG